MNKKYGVILGAAVMSIFAIAIAYAAMSTTLNITVNKVTQNALTWNVAFVAASNVTATPYGTSDTGRTCGTATVTTSAITVTDTTLSKPGDGCRYTFQVKNSGGIAAKVGQISWTAPSGSGVSCSPSTGTTLTSATSVCGNITYKIASDTNGSTVVTTSNTTVAAGNTQTLYLFVNYTGSGLVTSAITQTTAKFALRFDQN